jgi:hypothetical protein
LKRVALVSRTPLRSKRPLGGTRRVPIRRVGKAQLAYLIWRDTIAIPYLDRTFGHVCACGCGRTRNLVVDHIKERSTHPGLVRSLGNVRWLAAIPCHERKHA